MPYEIREYFLIENFHTQNDYTQANPFLRKQIFNHTLRNGVLVFHIEDEDKDLPANSNIDIECSDGLWEWDLSAGQSTPADKSDDWIYKKTPAPNSSSSYDGRDFIYIQVGSYLHEYMALTPGSVGGGAPDYRRRYTRDEYLGDNEDFFRVGETNVFSRYSNPNTNKADLSVTNRGFEVTSYNSSTKEYTLKVAIDNNGVLDLAPSKPQNPKVEVYTGGGEYNPKITWAAMSEPDVTTGGNIYVERSRKNTQVYPYIWSAWQTIATLSGTSTEYIDEGITTAGMGNDSVKYRIRARDSQNKYSVYSEEVKMRYDRNLLKRGLAEPKEYLLSQNYPNPFNPSTTIKFEIPEDENVVIKVYNLLGKEVATLVNGFKTAGYYETNFDASSLSSGIYIYRLTAGKYSETRKMTLMK